MDTTNKKRSSDVEQPLLSGKHIINKKDELQARYLHKCCIREMLLYITTNISFCICLNDFILSFGKQIVHHCMKLYPSPFYSLKTQ